MLYFSSIISGIILGFLGDAQKHNRPFYSSLLSNLAFEWQRGWSWPCFDTDLTAFVVLIKLFLC